MTTVEKIKSNFTIDSILENSDVERESLSPSSDFLKSQRRRSTFTALQVHILEAEFFQHRYVSPERRAFLSSLLNLTQQQVKIWFQNRRYKTKTKPESKIRSTEQYLANLQAMWMTQSRPQFPPPPVSNLAVYQHFFLQMFHQQHQQKFIQKQS